MTARILIADPDCALTEAYREYLTEHGFQAVAAADGVECVRLLRQVGADVLFLSASLPWGGCDGVLAWLKEEPSLRPTFVVVLVSAAERSALYRLAPCHIDDYQFKPFSPARLTQYAENLLADRADLACPAQNG
jgi:two-component system OmpR family response regulator